MRLTTIMKNAARRLGLEVGRARPVRPSVLEHLGIDIVFDVGANTGQYAVTLRESGYAAAIVSFEPLADAHARLTAAARRDARWTVHARCAIGAAAGEATLHIAGNSVSSSLLPMLPEHAASSPESVYVGNDVVPVVPLDAVFDSYCQAAQRAYLKIDAQGYERAILDGAERALDRIVALQLELSTVPLYESQELFTYFIDRLQRRGFELWSLLPDFTDPRSGRLLQFDGIFARTTAIRAAHA